jgi:hypothetical protein
MTQLQKWMDEAKANGVRKAFIVIFPRKNGQG